MAEYDAADTKAASNRGESAAAIATAVRELQLPDRIGDAASDMLVVANEHDLLRGRGVRPFAAAALRIESVAAGLPRPLCRISTVLDVDELAAREAVKQLQGTGEVPLVLTDVEIVLIQLCFEADPPDSVATEAFACLEALEDSGKTINRSRAGIAAACLVYAYGLVDLASSPTQEEIAAMAGTTPMTTYTRRNELEAVLEAE
ncbi:hypothetical protein K6T50_15930 (plasmid) [Halobaculum magnesiiphilum]|uniref:Transcription factor TFIIB cyclin-like domain-containing protein n=1 Tax=Halobaculum magnesiiphilum TaxID=1017351 RepID=A0A8T8WHZ3_9EURY|nr:hypothetical protein K6T50_15930 [Halobaculum magnesiiphilum]